MEVKYNFNEKNEFVIEGYDKAKTFASFLPGIAGTLGIPMWSYYVNRGQCMGSFGVKDKNNTIMEFFPANMMYKNIELQGFRTFIKINGEIHEIFSSMSRDKVRRRMIIEKNILKIEEVNETLNLKVTVTYFTMPNESFAAIVRKVETENLDGASKDIEILDGLTQILPYGVSNSSYQEMSNLLRAWFDVYNLENNIAYYKVRATTSDSAEVEEVNKGNFYLSFSSESKGLIPPIIDMNTIFGSNTAFTYPEAWDCSSKELRLRRQVPENKVSGGFTAISSKLENKVTIVTLLGHISSPELINARTEEFTLKYIEDKEKDARELIDKLVSDTFTKTSNHQFDKYIDQCYLDNILRGGYPLIYKAGDKNHVYHVYSRKHGDMEREYNFFSLEPAYYSQGNGNFRDVNQNRRNDVLFKPEVRDFNVKQFMSLIQLDGYNPLSVKGSTFTLNASAFNEVMELVKTEKDGITKILKGNFTPGMLINYIVNNKASLKVDKEVLLLKILENSKQNYEAELGEGYWSDHFTYNFDLVESYLQIYPDKLERFVFSDNTYRFFDSPVRVLPRSDKYVIANGKVRQYGAIQEDEEKCHKLNINAVDTNWLKTENGSGKIYETNLYVKLVALALIKFVSLDPYGMGIEMEGNKPGWNDAMNGLPGLFGSGLSETAELKRIVDFILKVSKEYDKDVLLPEEIIDLLRHSEELLDNYSIGNLTDFQYWDKTATLREVFRDKIRYGISGNEEKCSTVEILDIFKKFNSKLENGLDRALKYGKGIFPTYFTYEAKKYEIIEGKKNPINGYDNVRVTEFECRLLPLFLEGPARALKGIKDANKARTIYDAIKKSEIYDNNLKMYKTSVPLNDITNETGRVRAFTAGWLERESVFMHMEYKYLLSLLKSGLYDEYYEDIQTAFPPFMNAEVYGRNILENSSFIASSVNPDEAVHGRGYVARLSGSTAEMLSMWFIMMAGHEIFTCENNELKLNFNPILPGWFFNEASEVQFRFLSKADVTYHNPKKINTYGDNGVKTYKIILTTIKEEVVETDGSVISGIYAQAVREGKVKSIDIFMR
ncbi:cellobiose phosphorylase [Clostridium sp.]